MKDLKGIRGKYYIASLIAQGEHECQDFKYAVNDARKIARSVAAFANRSGGRLLVGVKDNGVVAGVRNEEDIYVVESAAESFCVPAQKISITPYICDGGARVMCVEIAPHADKGVCVREEGGRLKAYYRVGDENISAPPLMVEAWRRRAQGRGHSLQLDGNTRRLMEMASRQQGVGQEEFAMAVRLSAASAAEVLLEAYAMGAVEMTLDHHGLRFIEPIREPLR